MDPTARPSYSTSHTILEKEETLIPCGVQTVPGMFRRTSKFFVVDYSELAFKAVAAISCNEKPHCRAVFVGKNIMHLGLAFCGVIEVKHRKESLMVKIPAEKSYDPAGVLSPCVSYQEFNLLVAFSIIGINAVLAGVSEQDFDIIKNVFQDILSTLPERRFLFEWIHLQIKLACYRKVQPMCYPIFLLTKVLNKKIMFDSASVEAKHYLEKVLECNHGNRNVKFEPQHSLRISTDPVKMAKRGMGKHLSKYLNLDFKPSGSISVCYSKALELERDYKSAGEGKCIVF